MHCQGTKQRIPSKESARNALIPIRTYLQRIILEITSVDSEINSLVPMDHSMEMDPSIEGIEERESGVTDTTEFGIIYWIDGSEEKQFFRLSQKHRCLNSFLKCLMKVALGNSWSLCWIQNASCKANWMDVCYSKILQKGSWFPEQHFGHLRKQ